MLTYKEARGMMERAHDGRRKLENNTWLEKREYGCICREGEQRADCGRVNYAVRLHSTDVVTLHPDGSYTLNSGGWRTVTTKDRINRYAPGNVFQSNGEWFYSWGGPRNRTEAYFCDGMRVAASGEPITESEVL